MQTLLNCINYIKNDNPNLTCKNSKRCELYYNHYCKDYQTCYRIDCAWCAVDCKGVKNAKNT